MADQTQNPEGKRDHDAEDKEIENTAQAPNPTDLQFFRDPVIYEQGIVSRADEETRAGHGTESSSGPRGNRRPDGEIQQEIENLLAWQKTIDASGIHVQVKDGVVTLSGNVKNLDEKQIAKNIAANVLGIREIDNLLNIDRPNL